MVCPPQMLWSKPPPSKIWFKWPTAAGVLDEHQVKLGAKIRRAELDKVPQTLILGGKEAEIQAASVRSRAKNDEGTQPFAEYLERVKAEIAARSLPGASA